MNNFMAAIAMMLVGGAIMGVVSYVTPGGIGYMYEQNSKLIAECEKNLPRNETCILIAIPKGK